ncbi:MAG: tyrosine-type recombinase/integrase [Chloroflexi bacterium]|nr:tyrosine-type recombinase/integrase [Chloroflexota bacterium]
MKNLLADFQKYMDGLDLSPLTVRGYMADLGHFSHWFEQNNGEALAVERITPTDVKEYKYFLISVEKRKASTVNRRLAALAALAKWARQTGQIQSNPTENIKGVANVARGPKWLDKHEQYALSRAIENDLQLSKMKYPKRWVTRRRDASLVLFLLHTGLRLNEAVELRMSDVQLSERKGNVMVLQGKGSKQRNVPLNSEARKALQEWMAVRPTSEFLWTVVEGTQVEALSGRTVQRILHRYGRDAKIDELTPHVCRHSFAKNLVDSGVGLEKVAALLGHSSLNTTRMYVTPSTHDLELAVENLAK